MAKLIKVLSSCINTTHEGCPDLMVAINIYWAHAHIYIVVVMVSLATILACYNDHMPHFTYLHVFMVILC